VIRIHPARILSWGIEPGHDWLFARDVTPDSTKPAPTRRF
jgi:hypothetical protein